MSLSKSRFIEMFGDVINNKKTWPTKRWSDVLNIVNGKNQKKVECENGIYPICGSGGEIGKTNEYLTKENSVIIGRKGNINNPILMKTKFWNVDTAFGLEPNNKEINVEYLYKFCELFDFQRLNKTVTIPSLTKSDLLKIEIPVPPMKLQEEYRNFLAQVDKSKFLLQKILEKLELLKKSRFIEMFGDLKENQNYRTILFSQCTKSMIKGPFGSDMKKSLYVPKGKDTYKVYIQLNAIQRNQSLGNYYISKDYFDKKISRFEVKPNDFIITCDGTLGKLLQLDENMEKGVISSSLLKITLDETVIDSSFFEILWTNVILPNLSRYTRNACLVHLPSVSTIGNLEFHLPDLYLQKEYTKLVKQIDKSKLVIQKSLEDLVGKS